jgi:hypothetical protein
MTLLVTSYAKIASNHLLCFTLIYDTSCCVLHQFTILLVVFYVSLV